MAADSAPQEAAPAAFAAFSAAEGGQLQGITTVRPRSAGSRGTREQQPVAQLLRGARLGRGRKLRLAGAGLRRASAPACTPHRPSLPPFSPQHLKPLAGRRCSRFGAGAPPTTAPSSCRGCPSCSPSSPPSPRPPCCPPSGEPAVQQRGTVLSQRCAVADRHLGCLRLMRCCLTSSPSSGTTCRRPEPAAPTRIGGGRSSPALAWNLNLTGSLVSLLSHCPLPHGAWPSPPLSASPAATTLT